MTPRRADDSDDELRERMLQKLIDEGIDPSKVHYQPWGAQTACGLTAWLFMPTSDSPEEITCDECLRLYHAGYEP